MTEPAGDALAGLSREEKALLFERLQEKKRKAGAPAGRIPRRPPGLAPLPLSFAQERLWFLDRMRPGSSAYNMLNALRVRGDLSPAVLEAALSSVAERHESLRTTFRESEGQPEQVIAPPARVFPLFADLAGLPPERQDAEAQRLAEEEAIRPFDLERGPLLRATLIRLGERRHILLLDMHHIVSDGWSMGVLVREITALYGAAREGRPTLPAELPELPIQYPDFAVWQRRWFSGEVLERQLAYWRERLADAPAALELPGDRPRPAVQSFRGGAVSFRVVAEVTRQLNALSRRREATLFMALLAAFQTLLHRLTGQHDLPVGSPIANRNRSETAPLIGFFVNTLVLRSDLAGDPTFEELLDKVRGTALAAYSHQDLPFERLVEELRPERHLSHSPLFQVMCTLQNAPSGQVEIPGLTFESVGLETSTAKFDLEVVFTEVEERLQNALQYNADLFDPPSARRLTGQLQVLLAAVAEDPGRPLSALPLLAPAERHQLLVEWNDTRLTLPEEGEEDVLALFAAQVARAPEAPAIVCGGERLRYGDLDRRADALAHRLRAAGVGPEVAVGLCLERTADLAVGMLGIWKAGGAYLPLDPGLPRTRLAFLLEDSAVPVLVTRKDVAGELPPHSAATVFLDEVGERADGPPAGRPAAGDLAYMIYTSGTTGQPKAVMVEHGQLASTLAAVRQAFGFHSGDRMPCVAPFSFDIFLFELLAPLLAGGTSVLLPLKPTLDVEQLVDELAEATLLHAVPALMRQVVEAASRRGLAADRLRAVFVGGDVVPPELLADLRAAFPRARVHEMYGPTETTIVCTSWTAAPADGIARSLLGRPLPNATIDLRDGAGNPLPIGAAGEIWIGGGGVSRGYWRRPELTAERFIERGGERFFRSGDLARRLPSGKLEFLGRSDEQVKVRGFRIELGEVESALARHPEVKAAVAAVRDDAAGGGRQLVAYVVPALGTAATVESQAHIAHWQALYEETYERNAGTDPAFNTEGWNSSYTGRPIPAGEMREWVEETAGRILALAPRRVLEIGCGTGLLLFRVAPRTERYLGTDFSQTALDGIRRHLDGVLPQVELARRTADDWSGIEPGSFDLVNLSSVAQYFPGVEYLVRVLEGAVRAAAPGGKVFLGDVRSLPLLAALHTSVELHLAPAEMPAGELRRRVVRRVADEEELLLHPGFFAALARRLPRIEQVEILLKRGRHHNELTRFRYDVLLHIAGGHGTSPVPFVRDLAHEEISLARIEGLVEEEPQGPVVLRGLPNARLAAEAVAVAFLAGEGAEDETVEDLRREIATRQEPGIDPETLRGLGARLGHDVELLVDSRSPFHFAAALWQGARPVLDGGWEEVASAWANDPLRGPLARRLVPELRRLLQAELPDYMVPTSFVLLDALPLTAHGKVDRAALPAPELFRRGAERGTAPRTPLEEVLAELWRDLLGIEQVGVEDNFFELGGHSLLAVQVVSRLRQRLDVELPVRVLFEEPTIAGLAARVERERRTAMPAVTIRPVPRDHPRDWPLPLSFEQERMWFLHQLDPGSAAYNLSTPLRLRGDLRPALLEATLRTVVRRHESLRTTFPVWDGRPYQEIHPVPEQVLREVDLRALPPAAREAELRRRAREEGTRPFDLARGPLLRSVLVRLAEDEGALLLATHHIVSDGWSTGVLVREVAEIYASLLRGREPELPELPVQYADFAVWQRQWLAGEGLERALAYWRQRLAGEAPVLRLPADHARPPMPTGRGATSGTELPPAAVAGLEALARGEGATPFMAGMAVFVALLTRYTGQEDVWLGSPVANRDRAEVQGLIGVFVNTLVLRTETAGGPDLRELVRRCRETALGAYAHQDLPFERLVEELRPERDPSRTPLFQVMYALQNAPTGALELPGLEVSPVPAGGTAVQFDLSLFLWPTGDGLLASFDYSRDLFDRPTIERLGGHFRALLTNGVARPSVPFWELPMLSEAEQRQLTEWNAETRPAPRPEGTLHELFAAQAERTPAAVAVIAGEERLTYADLAGRASRLAARLRRLGVRAEVPVAVCLPRSADLIVSLLAVLEAGGFYVPLDPAYPAERLSFLLADSGARIVLTDRCLAGRLPEHERTVFVEEEDKSERNGAATSLPGHLAYLIYTSGSTGRPKAVAVEHRSAVLLAHWALDVFGPAELAGVLASTSLAFDLSVFEIFVPLAWGGTVILADDALALPSLPAAGEVRLVNTVPSVLAELLRAGGLPAGVTTVNLAGEALPGALARRIYERPGVERLYNLYGPSEDTTYSTWALVERDGDREPAIGRPVRGTSAYVVDRRLGMQPAGVPGELCLGGGGLARGYFGRPELTAERFVPDPFTAEEGARMYRTGDLARRRLDGILEYLGRLDQQVKVRGFRIELGEVEAALSSLPGVESAAVLVREERPGDRRLVAWVTPAELQVAALRDELRRRLPDFMLPSVWHTLATLPRTPTGKLDRRALSASAGEAALAAGGEHVPPRTPVEVDLAGIWREILGTSSPIGAFDDFFTLGGHSLLAVQVLARVRDLFQAELHLRVLFEEPTLAGLAARIERERRTGGPVSPVVPIPRDGELPLSFEQERMWFLYHLAPHSPAFNLATPLRLRGDLRPALLDATLLEVVRRHEVLRTTFPEAGGRPRVEIHPAPGSVLRTIDLRGLPEPQREAELAHWQGAVILRPFDLGRDPLLRVVLIRLADGDGALLFTVHHIVSDGWSNGILVREVTTVYGSLLRGETPELPPLPVQYVDFAAWQRQWLTGPAFESDLAYWLDRLAGKAPALALPADHPRPPMASGLAGGCGVDWPEETVPRLEALARGEKATLYMAGLASFQLLLARVTGERDLWIGSPMANRDRSEIQGLIGSFVNSLVMRTDISGDPTFRELLRRARETALGAFAHQGVPIERLVEELQPERDLSRTPLFQVMFAMQNLPVGHLDLPGLELAPLFTEEGASQFDLSLTLRPAERGMLGSIEYSLDLFERTTIERMAGHLRTLIEGAIADPETRIWDLPMLSEAEGRQLTAWSGETRLAPEITETLHGLFAAQARRTPQAVAVIAGEERLSYEEVALRAARLAGRLRRLGVGPEVPVALWLPRSADLIVALLGVLEAGGFYVPLDPAYPAERIAFLLADSGARAVLSNRELAPRLPAEPSEVRTTMLLDDAETDAAEALSFSATPGNLAYLIYTSGSTGRPKAVAIEHRSAVLLAHWARGVFGPAELSGVLASTSLAFDLSVFEIFVPLAWGGTVILAADALALPSLPAAGEVRLVNTVPSVLTELLRLDGLPASVTTVNLAGEPLPRVLARRLYERLGIERLYDLYGPSEDTTYSTWSLVERESDLAPSIGGPIEGTRAWVVNDKLGLQPAGIPGELCLGGGGLARGYFGQPDLTAERFLPDPFSGEAGARLYRTGDLARHRPDGTLEYLGRIDQQVKVRGFRIEPGEVEAALTALPGVESAAVLLREDQPGDRRLAAWVTPADLPIAELRETLRRRLPDFMVPTLWSALPSLPRTATGKLDRRALLAMPTETSPRRDEIVPPRTPAEQTLADIWREVLGPDTEVGALDDFFALGGHSLLATRVLARVREVLGVDLPVRVVFESPTLEAMAAEIETARAE